MKIETSVVLITGGASGLGRATAERLVAGGARVVLCDLDDERGASLASQLGDRAIYLHTDVTEEASVAAAVERGEAHFGPINGLVTCAGVLYAEKLIGRDDRMHQLASFERVIRVNVSGTFIALRTVAAAIARRAAYEKAANSSGNTPFGADDDRGVIVLVSSIAAYEAQLGQIAYAASKGAIAAMVLPAARELARYAVRVVAIAPAAMQTPMIDAAPAAVQQSLVDQTLFPHRLGRPEEFAQLVEQIFANQLLNGSVIRLDGGVRMSAR